MVDARNATVHPPVSEARAGQAAGRAPGTGPGAGAVGQAPLEMRPGGVQRQDVHRVAAAGAAAAPDHQAAAGAGRRRDHGPGITPSEAARHAGVSWPTAHDAFAAAADPVLEQAPAPVAHLGIDEHRRGFGLAAGTWPGLAVCVVVPAVAMLRRIQVEEAELTRVLGDPYRAYRNRTKRLIPGLW